MRTLRIIFGLFAALLCAGCVTNDVADGAAETHGLKIDDIFFAQHHVLRPDSPYFKLVGDLDALIKVQVYSDEPAPSPRVTAILELNSERTTMDLRGPDTVPKKPDCDPVLMTHSYKNSFTAMVPREWIKPGLKVTVELRDYNYFGVDDDDRTYDDCTADSHITVIDREVLDELKIGAPTKVVIQMFDVHYFGKGKGADFPEGWQSELEAKLPVAELIVHRVKGLMFNDIVMPPMHNHKVPSAKYSSPEDYKKRTGLDYDGEQGIALRWCSALKAAGGRYGLWRPYHINIGGVYSGGQAGGYRSCANLHRHGVIIHELGHTFGLPHWARNKDYPYKRSMYGKDQGEPAGANAGPTWAFDVARREFIPPRKLQSGQLVWKKDPMQGGGRSGLKNYMYRHFSDYSINKMQRRFEERAAYWNEDTGQYAQWSQETGAYDKVVENDGVKFPIERDADVVSLLVTASTVTPDANIIYPPIGPYKAGLIHRFDASSARDRQRALTLKYAREKSNVCLRVTQGGKVSTYLMPLTVSADDDPLKAFHVAAINLPLRDGDITQADSLHCPDMMTKGVTSQAKILYSWRKQ